jgi:heptosyltransferase-2
MLKIKKFDRVFIFPNSLGSTLTCFLAGIPERIGFGLNGRSFFLTETIKRDQKILSKHQVHYYKKLLENMGKTSFPELPYVNVPENNIKWAREFLFSKRNSSNKFLVGINPGSTYGEAKQWLPERFGELAKRLYKNNRCDIIIFGDKDSSLLAGEINNGLENKAIDVTGKTDILQLTALLKECDLLVTNDTGPMHVACAVKTPVVAIYGSTNQADTSPLGRDAVIIKKDIPCSPCLKRICPEKHHMCMKNISTDDVEKAVLKKLKLLKRINY